jgi:heme oxygenase
LLKKNTESQQLRFNEGLQLLRGVVSFDDYRDLLSRFYGIYAPLEAVLWRALDSLKDDLQLAGRRKTPQLSIDLSACGFSNAEIVAIARCSVIAPFPSVPQALGALYVLECATIDAQVVARRLRKLFSPKKSAGLAFFSSYGAQTPDRSRQFRNVLSAHLRTAAQQDQAVNAAIETYSLLQHWLVQRNDA